jgi:hypothetical protein
MANRPAPLKQTELTRYLKAWKAAGYREPRVEIRSDGTISISPVEDRTGVSINDWD